MQTFLPYSDFAKSARCLDRQRLGKQRVECLQILRTLTYGGSWENHPAVLMWRGHKAALACYGINICMQWILRGYRDTCRGKILRFLPNKYRGLYSSQVCVDYQLVDSPPWLGQRAFHASHQSNLLRKDPVWYGQWGWTVGVDLPYVWPIVSHDV